MLHENLEGVGWEGGRGRFRREGTDVHLWLIHADVGAETIMIL